MTHTDEIIEKTERYGANNYHPLPIVISKAQGVWVWDADGNRYLDMLSAYSALNQGHCHPRLIQTLKDQAERVTLTSRAFHNDQLAPFYEKVAALTKKEMILPMNTGAEAVETALKAARRWAYDRKGVKANQAEVIVCHDNFHGRTLGAVSLSSNDEYKRGFGPLLPGIKTIPYGDAEALEAAINENTAAFLVEPIQGEAGIIIPPEGYLKQVRDLCSKHNVLFIADEIQSGLGRTGELFACDHEAVEPDMFILGKALGGGVMPVSAVAASKDVLGVFEPGSHGSTFGGNPLACAVAIEALNVLEEERLVENAKELGTYFMDELNQLTHSSIREVRGKGLFIGIELTEPARPFCEKLKEKGLLCKETHENVIRFAPPLIITKEELQEALDHIRDVL
ncbi:ornithine aminotransferase [Bacillus sp. JCM 19045]|uniref:Ornithine aminotransferase n=1 Tax=Shouchella xiaoxiensis TaxID=766895 RepID=A0ABS2T0N8_9BACI|nr:ornithine--oxo-acid transaminase [Shouchella xiaoxiensis]MBM7841348.1 ornithine--oxo-acid transaminase [Shouchella xiaoxiensis]GAF12687.1 ornithine aminotransferase [Bacillus sp. JCM 19045]